MPTGKTPEGEAPSAQSKGAAGPDASRPTLPPNVSIFTPPNQTISDALLQSRIFTRLTISPSNTTNSSNSNNDNTQQVTETLRKRPELTDQKFWLVHQNAVVLVFDSSDDEEDEETIKDRHHEHVRSVCLALKDGDLSLSIAGCVFDATNAVGAGFQFDRLSRGAVLVIDLMDGGGDDDSDDDGESSDDDEFDLLAGGEVVA